MNHEHLSPSVYCYSNSQQMTDIVKRFTYSQFMLAYQHTYGQLILGFHLKFLLNQPSAETLDSVWFSFNTKENKHISFSLTTGLGLGV